MPNILFFFIVPEIRGPARTDEFHTDNNHYDCDTTIPQHAIKFYALVMISRLLKEGHNIVLWSFLMLNNNITFN